MELHGDMIDHGQPVVSVFHRPRAEAHLLEAQGFDPRAASFMFVNIATADMGPWMQQLVNNEGWLRNSIQLASTPFSVGLPSQRPFEAMQTLCFRHPSLPALEQYYLPFPAESLPGKCFVSLPRTCSRRNGTPASRGPRRGTTGKTSTTRTRPSARPVVEVEAPNPRSTATRDESPVAESQEKEEPRCRGRPPAPLPHRLQNPLRKPAFPCRPRPASPR